MKVEKVGICRKTGVLGHEALWESQSAASLGRGVGTKM